METSTYVAIIASLALLILTWKAIDVLLREVNKSSDRMRYAVHTEIEKAKKDLTRAIAEETQEINNRLNSVKSLVEKLEKLTHHESNV